MEQSIAAPPDAPDDSRSSPMQYSAALTMAKSLAKTSSDLHDTAKELNRQSPTSMIQNSSDADGTSEDIENSNEARVRKNSVKQIVQQFEEKMNLEKQSCESRSICSSTNLDYSDDDTDDINSEFSFSIGKDGDGANAHSYQPQSLSVKAKAATSNPKSAVQSNSNSSFPAGQLQSASSSRASTPTSVGYPPSSPSSLFNHYISSTEVSPVAWEMLSSANSAAEDAPASSSSVVSEPSNSRPPLASDPPQLTDELSPSSNQSPPQYVLSPKYEHKR